MEQIRYMLDPTNFWSPGYPSETTNSDDDNDGKKHINFNEISFRFIFRCSIGRRTSDFLI